MQSSKAHMQQHGTTSIIQLPHRKTQPWFKAFCSCVCGIYFGHCMVFPAVLALLALLLVRPMAPDTTWRCRVVLRLASAEPLPDDGSHCPTRSSQLRFYFCYCCCCCCGCSVVDGGPLAHVALMLPCPCQLCYCSAPAAPPHARCSWIGHPSYPIQMKYLVSGALCTPSKHCGRREDRWLVLAT